MKLKRVKLYGFKTFADRTEFDLDGDVVAIIGPNGCGKSNIVDSILWGLGESNSRHLRAQTAKEVIFSGSRNRKQQGFAEVTLLFENEDGSLPIDTSEVSVTRRLTRGGDSDYEINKRSCRMRDVNDLLADSGLGRAGYAIVSQSEIDQALAASPEKRRAWIDEAAGVQRYRARRIEAERRLESAEGHLSRVHDILSEIETQREPLREEAEIAAKYKVALASLREVESGLLMKEIAAAREEICALEARIASVLATCGADSEEAVRLDAEARAKAESARAAEVQIEQIREAQQVAQARVERSSAALQVARHKLEGLDSLESSLSEDSGELQARIAEAEADLAKCEAAAQAERVSLESLQKALAGASTDAKQFAEELKALDQELAKAKEAVAQKHRIEIEMAHRETRLRQVKAELQGIVKSLPDLTEGVVEADNQVKTAQANIDAVRERLKHIEAELRGAEDIREKHAADQRALLAKLAHLDGRRRGIESTIEAHEGVSHGARAVLDLVQAGRLPDEFRLVGDSIDVPGELALAIETAIGAAVNDLIVPHEKFAKEAISILKSERLGRATFQPVTLVRPNNSIGDLASLAKRNGVVGVASDLVDCDRAARPVIDSLLGRVLIAETIDDALALGKTRGWSKIVTLAGEVIHSSGAVTGGVNAKQSAGLVQRKAELADVEVEIEATEARLAELEKKLSGQQGTAETLAEREAAKSEEAGLQIELDDLRTWMLGLKHEHTTTIAAEKRLTDELAKLQLIEFPHPDAVDLPGIEARRDDVLRNLAAKSGDADSAQERLVEAESRCQAADSSLRSARNRLESLADSVKGRERRLENLGPDRERYEKQIHESAAELDASEREVQELRGQVFAAIDLKKSLSAEAMQLAESAREAEKRSMSGSETVHQCEIRRARADSKKSAAVMRLLEEYGIDEDGALANVGSVELPADAPEVAGRLRRELKSMGEVNLGAVEAYQRMTERFEELNGQSEDITTSILEIRATVKELDSLTRDRFHTTFEALKVAFAETFTKMFGGGEGVIEMSNSLDSLDSGVEISVTVPGKKRQRLELLSGGERAMSACAFLFALLKVKPTPLVVLDEVDAPLDGRNVERFISMLREFSGQTQFLLVTHNPVTIESADVWFGVTMQEPGVSTLVPFKMARASLA